ncbi:TPA: hypothetical protein ACKRPP_001122 [Proteus mirabilis]
MNAIRRQNTYYLIVVILSLVAYFVFDVSFWDYSWPIKIGILSFFFSAYSIFVVQPTFFEMFKNKDDEIEKLRLELLDTKDEIRQLKWEIESINMDINMNKEGY